MQQIFPLRKQIYQNPHHGAVLKATDIKEKVERLFLCIRETEKQKSEAAWHPDIPSGTDSAQEKALRVQIEHWDIFEEIDGLVFDTTASNSGKWQGLYAYREAPR